MLRSLKPWSANLKKRQVKSPKIYIRDSGLLHHFLGLTTRAELERPPKIGASWEGFIIENLIQGLGLDARQCHYWATHSGAEIDLVVQRGSRLRGFEIKRTSAPTLTRSMRSAMEDLGLSRLDVIHAGDHTFPLSRDAQAVSAAHLLGEMKRTTGTRP